jgi:hypothetical protein
LALIILQKMPLSFRLKFVGNLSNLLYRHTYLHTKFSTELHYMYVLYLCFSTAVVL